jgi:hypothetical protein
MRRGKENKMYYPTDHALTRSAQRNLPIGAVEYIVDHARVMHKGGVLYFYLRCRDIPMHDRKFPQIARLAGTAVVLSQDRKTIITIWRNRKKGMRYIKRKPNGYPSGNSTYLFI